MSRPLRHRSGGGPVRIRHKPGNKRGRLPEWSSSWSRYLPEPDDTKLWPRRWTPHSDEFTRKSSTAPPVHLQESRKRTALPVNCNSGVRIRMRRLKRTNSCWPLSFWQTTRILPLSITISTEFPSCRSDSAQRCQRLTGIDWRWPNWLLLLSHGGRCATNN